MARDVLPQQVPTVLGGVTYLKHWDWDAQAYATVDYPDAMVQPFVDWLVNTKALEQGDLRRISDRVLQFQRDLTEYRSKTPAQRLLEKRQAQAAKMRAARKAKREAVPA